MAEDGKKDQARGIRREQDQVRFYADRDSIRKTGYSSTTDESEPERGNREDFEEADTEQGAAVIGKILSQLREVKEAHLAYVSAHTERLKKRLVEDENHRSKIIQDMEALEREILLMRTSSESAADEEG